MNVLKISNNSKTNLLAITMSAQTKLWTPPIYLVQRNNFNNYFKDKYFLLSSNRAFKKIQCIQSVKWKLSQNDKIGFNSTPLFSPRLCYPARQESGVYEVNFESDSKYLTSHSFSHCIALILTSFEPGIESLCK